jgi:phage-related protein
VVHTWAVKIHDKIPVVFFKTDSGSEAVREWLLEGVTEEERKIIGKDVKVVQLSWPIGMPLVESFGDGLWQVRSTLSDRIARVFFTFNNSEIVLLHGFIKKARKTPKSDLELAKKRKNCFRKG